MRLILLALALPLLAACGREPTRLPELGMADQCGTRSYSSLLNQPRSALTGIEFQGPVRIIAPGDPITRDMRPDRVNFMLNDQDFITGIRCG